MRKKGIWILIFGLSFFVVAVMLTTMGADAVDPPERKCLIIVSDPFGPCINENGKALSFYYYCTEISTYTSEDITFLGDPSIPNTDGPANVSNVEAGFDWLVSICNPTTEVVIYISDHTRIINGIIHFIFNNGIISVDTIDQWIGQIICSKVTIILNGERSGLGGEDLADPSRDVICSMRADQTGDPYDLFNITRSLEDPTADLDSDGIVDYIEAFTKEVELLQGSGQDPVIYQGS